MEENKVMVSSPFELHLVHLDLKGAPPKVSYLAEIFPLFRDLGASGILLEYEDTFPYDGELRPLQANDAYSPAEIKEILNLAKLHKLEVVPLVQTFGHMEFVLKHKEFQHLREVATFPNTVNPHKEESLRLVCRMIEQVLALHEELRWFHIGCDEVYYLGEGEESKKWLQQEENTIEKLCLAHLKAVASHVVSAHPTVKPLVWDDMLREMSEEALRDSGVAQLVEPMIWDYASDFDVSSKAILIEKYQKCNFPKLWFASAFKGATGVNQCLTLTGHHLKNHQQWLKVAESTPAGIIQGIILTGWQSIPDFLFHFVSVHIKIQYWKKRPDIHIKKMHMCIFFSGCSFLSEKNMQICTHTNRGFSSCALLKILFLKLMLMSALLPTLLFTKPFCIFFSRYDHFSVLCELLPVGIPSLAICLQALKNGGYSEKVKEDVEKLLGITSLEIDTFMSDLSGTFPGCEILSLVTQIAFYLKPSVDELLENNRFVTGWFSPYHRKRKKIHPVVIHLFQPEALRLLTKWNTVTQDLQAAMEKVFYMSAVEEWIEEYIRPSLQRLQDTVDDLDRAIEALT